LEPGLSGSFFTGQPGANMPIHLLLYVELQLIVHFIFNGATPKQGTKPEKYIAEHLRASFVVPSTRATAAVSFSQELVSIFKLLTAFL
jgi:hypothetical protein